MATIPDNLITVSLLFIIFCSEYARPLKTFSASTSFLFSDKTPYHSIPKPIEKPPRCEPVYIDMVIRHGSRYPGSTRIKKMKDLLKEINRFLPANSTISYKDLSLPWKIPHEVLNAANKEMSTLGSEEMYSIAKRFRSKFHRVLQHSYSNNNYSFIATDKLRSSQSAVAFAQGLFEGTGHLGPGKYQPVAVKFSGSYDNDNVLRIFEACPKWQKLNAKRNAEGKTEYAKFLNGQELRRVVRNISDRLKLGKKFSLRPNWVVEMFLMCAFGIQTDSKDTSWCSVFEEEDLTVLEYLSDLKHYWSRSYGRQINYRMSCPLYSEITNSFERFLQFGKPYGAFRFAHTGTVIPLLTMLGLYNDTLPPRADNFDQQGNRTFRISNVVPMAANVAFVLYNCQTQNAGKGNKDDIEEKSEKAFRVSQMMVQLLVNEAPVPMPGCGGRMYCRLNRFLSYYSHIQNNCDIKSICGKRQRKCKKSSKQRPQD